MSQKRIRNAIVFAVVVGSIVVFALEAVVRLLGLAPPLVTQYKNYIGDPHLPYKPAPNSVVAGRSSTDEFDFEYKHNSFGFRDVEHLLEKKGGVYRILGLGDSFTYGAGAAFEETYLRQLEKMLNNDAGDGAKFEVIKAGIGRYFPEPERILLEQYGRHYQPDLILVGFLPNDVIDTYNGIGAVVVDKSGYLKSQEAQKLGSLGFWLHNNSHLCRIILKRYVYFQFDRKHHISWPDVYKADGIHEKDWQAVEREYARMLSIANEIGARLVIVHIPQKGPWEDIHSYPSKRLAAWADSNGAGFVDTLPGLSKGLVEELYFPKDGHATPA